MARMTNFRSAAIATGNAINDSAYDSIKIVVDNLDDVLLVANNINAGSSSGVGTVTYTTITQGEGVPTSTFNPTNGTNALYLDTLTDTVYACKSAATNNNVWMSMGSAIVNSTDVSIDDYFLADGTPVVNKTLQEVIELQETKVIFGGTY